MPIKVCKKAAINKVSNIAIALTYISQIIFPVICIIGVIQIINNDNIGVIRLFGGLIFSAMAHLYGAMAGYNIIMKLQNKYKIFAWNEDC
jgi:hypothetical protein